MSILRNTTQQPERRAADAGPGDAAGTITGSDGSQTTVRCIIPLPGNSEKYVNSSTVTEWGSAADGEPGGNNDLELGVVTARL